MWLHCFWVCALLYILKVKEVTFLVNDLFNIVSDVVAVVLQSCVQKGNLTGAYMKNVLLLCLIFQNTGEFTKLCKFRFYGACNLCK